MLNVTKSYLPPLEEYVGYLKKIWETHSLTNGGQLSRDLEFRLKEFLGVRNILFTSNGTISLQLAIKALDLKREIITTPFSYVATLNSVLWEKCRPVFVDIEEETFGLNPDLIEQAITENTEAILGVHVYGYPCKFKEIQEISKKHNLRVIYDAAHATGVKYKGVPLASLGDISTLSFHATKAFHTAEGGAIVTNDSELAHKIQLLRSFGHLGDRYFSEGINGKNSEFHAALGLCNLDRFEENNAKRKKIFDLYNEALEDLPVRILSPSADLEYNYSYYVIVFENESALLQSVEKLSEKSIFPRRYFYPSLNTLPFVDGPSCPVSERLSKRVLCLPLSVYLLSEDILTVSEVIRKSFKS